MTICIVINPVPVGYGALAGVVIGTCLFCIWNGRKIMKKWIGDEKPIPVPWKDDDNNPANWYLKDPNKFRITNDKT